jgi:tRNA1Val (adenine37-N6)-methyltransferase
MDFEQTHFWQKSLHIWQPKRGHGYRFNLDPVLLYGFAPQAHHVLDLGSGTGILALLLLASGKAHHVTCVEVQPSLAEWALRNAHDHGFQDRMHVICEDVRAYQGPVCDAVVCNPPYFTRGAHVASPHLGRDIARHEVLGTLHDFVACAAKHLKPQASASFIVPFQRRADLHKACADVGCSVATERLVHPRALSEPGHLLVQTDLSHPPRPCMVQPPLVVHSNTPGVYTPEVAGWLRVTS